MRLVLEMRLHFVCNSTTKVHVIPFQMNISGMLCWHAEVGPDVQVPSGLRLVP